MKRKDCILGPLAAALLWALVGAPWALAQSDEEKPKRAAARSPTISAQPAQRKPAARMRLAAPEGEGLKYICNSGNCACAGVQDCVDMKDICAPATMGCNKHGCTCQEGDSGDDGG